MVTDMNFSYRVEPPSAIVAALAEHPFKDGCANLHQLHPGELNLVCGNLTEIALTREARLARNYIIFPALRSIQAEYITDSTFRARSLHAQLEGKQILDAIYPIKRCGIWEKQ